MSETSATPPDAEPRPTGSKTPIDLPLRQAMPKALLLTFSLLCLVALGFGVFLLVRPTTFVSVPVEERRPAPGGDVSHAAGEIAPAPVGSTTPSVSPPCDAFAGTRFRMSGDGIVRMRHALDRLCRLSGGGVGEELAVAIDGLGTATIGFAQFEAGGIESTYDSAERVLWLNLRFARRGTSIDELLPPLVHEGYHLGSDTLEPTAEAELAARRAEHEACRHLIARAEWPRWCTDAETLVELPEDEAIRRLRAAGYAGS